METNIEWVLPESLPEGVLKKFSLLFSTYASSQLIRNVETQIRIIKVSDNLYFPVSVNNTEWNNSYVCSPYTAYVLYAKDELTRKVKNKLLQFPLLLLIQGISGWLKSAQINKNIHVNNFLLSTNPYPDWNGEHLDALTNFLKDQYPEHAIIFRSLNRYQHSHLLTQFQNNTYYLIGSRQVYLYDDPFEKWLSHNNNKQDKRIIKNKKLQYVSHEDMKKYISEALDLYNQLYLEKYSPHNPQFTLEYFQKMYDNDVIHFQGYINSDNQLKAFSGLFVIENTITSPLVGYDTKAPQKDALYIHAIQLIFEYKYRSGRLLNLSSGAPGFKRLRGGLPSIEYSAVYLNHLKIYRRIVYKVLQFITNKIGVPLLEKYEL
ncbi:hypothetical protein QNI16_24640 [Cytophagaceae bacterium YF14B1]|uniref:Uncharacterized protein n=1 Tax=Xanthocytophaga flava TaxID=3048013 RepID=A0AAE3QUH6_9BACT|nr:hypothetical protein [Xanthocytophaga flavus]MDJ1483710.1 hypothetical protein [Xanthocytophaga flavus]